MTSEEASAFFFTAIAQNAKSREMIKKFSDLYRQTRRDRAEEADIVLDLQLLAAVANGHEELKASHLKVAYLADPELVRRWIREAVVKNGGRTVAVGSALKKRLQWAKIKIKRSE